MNESITRAAGSEHGQETSPQMMLDMISSAGRQARQRTTAYGEVDPERQSLGFKAGELSEIINTPAKKFEREEKPVLVKNKIKTSEPTKVLQ